MKLIDYSGKLNCHDEYLRVLNMLEKKCKWIEYVLVSDDESFVGHFQNSVGGQKVLKSGKCIK